MPSSSASTPARASASRSSVSRRSAAAAKRLRKPPVVGVDEELLAGLGVLHRHQAEVGQVHLERIEQAHGGDFVALRELAERFVPARRADEIGDDEDQSSGA